MPAPDFVATSCNGCGRKQRIPREQVGKRRCAFCGANLVAEAGQTPEPAPEGARSMTLTCPVCLVPFRYPGMAAGRTSNCKYCGSPFRVPPAEGPALEIDPDYGASKEPVRLPCPSCGKLFPVPGDTRAVISLCSECHTPVDLATLSLESLFPFGLPPAASRLTALIQAALARRWQTRSLCVSEASNTLRTLALVETWTPGPGEEGPISPLPASFTIELAKYLVWKVPDALLTSPHPASWLLQIPLKKDGAFPWQQLLAGTARELIRATLLSGGSLGRKEAAVEIRDQLFLEFHETPEGTTVSSYLQSLDGPVLPTDPDDLSPLRTRLREQIPNAARAVLAIRSLFGSWANLQTHQAAHERAISAKIAALGGPFPAEAGVLTLAIKRR